MPSFNGAFWDSTENGVLWVVGLKWSAFECQAGWECFGTGMECFAVSGKIGLVERATGTNNSVFVRKATLWHVREETSCSDVNEFS